LANQDEPTIASLNLQGQLQHLHLHIIEKSLKKCKIKVNESKSSHIKFTLSKCHCPAVKTNQTVIPETEEEKYLGLGLVFRLNWKEHIAKKIKQSYIKTKEINCLIGKKSHPSIENNYSSTKREPNQYRATEWKCGVALASAKESS
jgi:hypothetical protein